MENLKKIIEQAWENRSLLKTEETQNEGLTGSHKDTEIVQVTHELATMFPSFKEDFVKIIYKKLKFLYNESYSS